MKQMKKNSNQRSDIDAGYKYILKTEHDHFVYIVTIQFIKIVGYIRISDLHGEVKNVIDKKSSYHEPRPDHCLASECRAETLFHLICLWPCSIVLQGQRNAEKDMDGK